MAGVSIVLYVGLAGGTASFDVGIFDGDVSGTWDSGSQSFVYRLYKDPLKNGATAHLVATLQSSSLPNDAWSDATYATDADARAPSGNFFYRLEAGWESGTPSGDFNNFKVRTTGQISVAAGQDFGFDAGPQNIGSDPDVRSGDPNPGDMNDANANSYDGVFTFFFYVPRALTSIEFWDGDADRAGDTDDPNTENTDPDGAGPAQAEGAHPGLPADDGEPGREQCCLVTPSIFHEIVDPDDNTYTNSNPSGNTEWERFVVGDSASNPDVVVTSPLSPGLWRFGVRGMDAHNLNVLRSTFEIFGTSDPPLPVNPAPSVEPDHELTTSDDVTVAYAHTVTNTGATADDFDLTATSEHGWTTAIYRDANGNGVVDAGDEPISRTGLLGPGEALPIVVTVRVPLLSASVTDVTVVLASSRSEWAVQDDARDTTLVQVNQAPSAEAGGPYAGFEGSPVRFDAGESSDPDGDALTYEWDWDGDGVFDESTTNAVVDHVFGDDLVEHAVGLRVSDGEYSATDEAFVTVANVAPVVSVLGVLTGKEGDTFALQVLAMDPGSDDLTVTWSWAFGPTDARTHFNDGLGPDPERSPEGTFPLAIADTSTHAYGDDCPCTVVITVEDDDGGLTTLEAPVEVVNALPTIVGRVTVTATTDLTLRIAGERWHDVTLTLYDGDTLVRAATLVRQPGSPDVQALIVEDVRIDVLSNSFRAVLEYTPLDDPINGRVWGSDPAWLILASGGVEVVFRHTFNARHSETWVWAIDDFRPFLVGMPIDFEVTGADAGSDDLTVTVDFGDGPSFFATVFRDGVGPDPFPSPDVNPIVVTFRTSHVYAAAGVYEVVVAVMDDDSGRIEVVLTIDLTP